MCILNSDMSWVLFSLSFFSPFSRFSAHKDYFQIQAQYLPMMYFQMCDDRIAAPPPRFLKRDNYCIIEFLK